MAREKEMRRSRVRRILLLYMREKIMLEKRDELVRGIGKVYCSKERMRSQLLREAGM